MAIGSRRRTPSRRPRSGGGGKFGVGRIVWALFVLALIFAFYQIPAHPTVQGMWGILQAKSETVKNWIQGKGDDLTNGRPIDIGGGGGVSSPTGSNPKGSPAGTSPQGSTAAIKSVHSPSTVAQDMNLTAGQCHVRVVSASSGQILPDSNCTPGAIDPAVTQANISTTICKSGYTATVRAPASNTAKFKKVSLTDYGMSYSVSTEYDHLISLELGGTNAVSNLWPEPNKTGATATANPKDQVENKLKTAVCAGRTTLSSAQSAIAGNWVTALSSLGLG